MLTKRQNDILKILIEDYVELAKPISSELFKEKHKLKISSPTVRLEFQQLTKKGFLTKAYFSSGRIPTDKAYRYFVDNLLAEKTFEIDKFITKRFNDEIKLFQNLIKGLSKISKTLIFIYLKSKKTILKEGWEEVLKEREFLNKKYIIDFFSFIEETETNIENSHLDNDIKIYIGKENHFKNGQKFTIIMLKSEFLKEEIILALLGPKRMNYNTNVGLMKSVKKYFENYVQ